MQSSASFFIKNRVALTIVLMIFSLLWKLDVSAQQAPPRPISVYFNPSQGLRFGTFFQGTSGGSVIIAPDGSRTVTGGVIEMTTGSAYGAANFEVHANPGTLISILSVPDIILTGSNGGTMTLHIGSSLPVSPFITTASPPAYTSVNVGGTLTVGSPVANPAGVYSGSFLITFMQE